MGDTKAIVSASNKKIVAPATIHDELSKASLYIRSGILPSRYTKPEAVVAAMHIAVELGLKPLISLRQIAVIKGTPSLFGDLPLSLVLASGLLIHHREYPIDDDGNEICVKNKNLKSKVFGVVCEVKRMGDSQITERYFTMDQAKTAGLLVSDAWAKYPQRMLTYRARSAALKDKFADCLNGLAIAEYDHDVIIDNDTGEIIGGDPDLQKIAFGKKDEDTVVVEGIEAEEVEKEDIKQEIIPQDPYIYDGSEGQQLGLFQYLQRNNIPNQYWKDIDELMRGKNKANELNNVINSVVNKK